VQFFLRHSVLTFLFTFPWSSSFVEVLTVLSVYTAFATHCFTVASTKIWNSLPPAVHACNSPDTFHSHLKTHNFSKPSRPLVTSLAPWIRLPSTTARNYTFIYWPAYTAVLRTESVNGRSKYSPRTRHRMRQRRQRSCGSVLTLSYISQLVLGSNLLQVTNKLLFSVACNWNKLQ